MNSLLRKRFYSVVVAALVSTGSAQASNLQESDNRRILWSVDWSADGKVFAVGGGWVGLFDAETNERRLTPGLDNSKSVHKVRWHPRRNLLALSGGANEVTAIYDPVTARKIPLKTMEGTRGIAWNASGDKLATAGNRGELQIWSVDGKLLQTTRPENAKSLTGVAWQPTENQIVTVGEFITLYDQSGRIVRQVRHRPEAKGMVLLLCVEWHPSGEFFAVGDYGNSDTGDAPAIQFWSSDCTLLRTIEVKGGAEFRNVSWSPDGSLLASASDALRIWTKDGELRNIGKSPDFLWGVRWNRVGDRLLTSSKDGYVTLWTPSAVTIRNVVEGAGVHPM